MEEHLKKSVDLLHELLEDPSISADVRARIKESISWSYMSKEDKKKERIQNQIKELETKLKTSITKKANGSKEMSIGEIQSKINALRAQL